MLQTNMFDIFGNQRRLDLEQELKNGKQKILDGLDEIFMPYISMNDLILLEEKARSDKDFVYSIALQTEILKRKME